MGLGTERRPFRTGDLTRAIMYSLLAFGENSFFLSPQGTTFGVVGVRCGASFRGLLLRLKTGWPFLISYDTLASCRGTEIFPPGVPDVDFLDIFRALRLHDLSSSTKSSKKLFLNSEVADLMIDLLASFLLSFILAKRSFFIFSS